MGLQLHTLKLSEEEIITAMCAMDRHIKYLRDTGEDSPGVREELRLEKIVNVGI